jgi:hypothetical protein
MAANSVGGTEIMIDPTGQDPSHAQALITLDHVLPQNLHAASLIV